MYTIFSHSSGRKLCFESSTFTLLKSILYTLFLLLAFEHNVFAQSTLNGIKLNGLVLPQFQPGECDAQKILPNVGEFERLSTLQKNPTWTFPSVYSDTQSCDGYIISYIPFREKGYYSFPFHWSSSSLLNFTNSIQNGLMTMETFFEPLYIKGVCGTKMEPFCVRLTVFDDTRPSEFRSWIKTLDSQAQCFYNNVFEKHSHRFEQKRFDRDRSLVKKLREDFLRNPTDKKAFTQFIFPLLWADYTIRF